LDIVVARFHSNNVLVLFGVGNGTFEKQTTIIMGYGSWSSFIALSDVNNDYLLDIPVTNNGFGNLEILSKIC
jgi:hypothetical protein